MKKILTIVSAVATLAACSSIKPDYVVQEANPSNKPAWVEGGISAVKQDGSSLYFIGNADNLNKRLCLKTAQVQADEQFALKINQQIIGKYKSTAASTESNTEEETSSKAEQKIYDELSNNVLAQLNGSVKVQEYWEKRAHKTEMGALKDYTSYSCYVLKKMDSKSLETMMKAHFNKKISELKAAGEATVADQKDLISAVSATINEVKAIQATKAE